MFVQTHFEAWDGKDVLVIEVPASRQYVSTKEGRIFRRRLKRGGIAETVVMKPYEIMNREISLQKADPSAQIIRDIPGVLAFSAKERDHLRNRIVLNHGNLALLGLSDDDLDRVLGFVREQDGKWYPTVAGLLMIGKEDYIRLYVPSHKVLFDILDGEDTDSDTSVMDGPLLRVLEKAERLLETHTIESGLNSGTRFLDNESEAFREGLIIALIHRDYSLDEPVRIQLQAGQLSISSPGGFTEGVSPNSVYSDSSVCRNRLLSEVTKRIGLSAPDTQGVKRMYSAMLYGGHPIPDYSASTKDAVVLNLNLAETDEDYIRMALEAGGFVKPPMLTDAMLVLYVLKREKTATNVRICKELQKPLVEVKIVLQRLIDWELIESTGYGRSRYYILGTTSENMPGNKPVSNSQHDIQHGIRYGVDDIQKREAIRTHLERYGDISRAQVIAICECSQNEAACLLRKMVNEGELELHGKCRGSYYKLRR